MSSIFQLLSSAIKKKPRRLLLAGDWSSELELHPGNPQNNVAGPRTPASPAPTPEEGQSAESRALACSSRTTEEASSWLDAEISLRVGGLDKASLDDAGLAEVTPEKADSDRARPDASEDASEDASKNLAFDLILWRPRVAWNDRHLERAAHLLAARGRLWILTSASHRRRLILDLGRLGFAVLEDFQSGGTCLLSARHDGFTVRSYEPGDEDEILRLFAPAFHVQRSPEHWRWKYQQNPWGQTLITLAHSRDGELAAHYAGYPVPYFKASSGETWMALQIGDTMTDPRFRRAGRGVSSLLGRSFRHFFTRHCEEKIAFNYGFNTGNIRRFNFQFIKGRLARRVDYWRRDPVPPEHAGYAVRSIDDAALRDDFDAFFKRVAKHYGFLLRRDGAWLRWRYLACPDDPPFRLFAAYRGRRLVGWSVFRRRRCPDGDQLLFVDALFEPKHSAAAADLLGAALGAEPGVAEIVGWMAPNPPWWRRRVEALDFAETVEPNDLALIYLPFTRPEVEQLLPEIYYTLGDGDLA